MKGKYRSAKSLGFPSLVPMARLRQKEVSTEDDRRSKQAIIAEVSPAAFLQDGGQKAKGDEARGKAEDHADQARRQFLSHGRRRKRPVLQQLVETVDLHGRGQDHGKGEAEVLGQ